LGTVDNIPAGLELGEIISSNDGRVFTSITTKKVHVGEVYAVNHTIIITIGPILVAAELLHVPSEGIGCTVKISNTVLIGTLLLWIIMLEDGFASVGPVGKGDKERPAKVAPWVGGGAAKGGVAVA